MTDPITPATIARLRELDAAATPVPWAASEWYCNDSEGGWAAIGPHHLAETDDIDDGPDGQLHKAAKADAALIAAMRNALPALLDQLAAQAAEIERVREERSTLEHELTATALAHCQRADKAEARVTELEGLLREVAWDANDINGLPQDEYNCLLRRIAAALAGRESGQ